MGAECGIWIEARRLEAKCLWVWSKIKVAAYWQGYRFGAGLWYVGSELVSGPNEGFVCRLTRSESKCLWFGLKFLVATRGGRGFEVVSGPNVVFVCRLTGSESKCLWFGLKILVVARGG